MAEVYSPLPSKHHIRLLRLERNPLREVIANLEVEDLDAQPAPEYACLSYTWGAPRWEDEGDQWDVPDQTVCINGHGMQIRANLRNALDHLPDVLSGRYIWIDAVCINQEDIMERNTQVALMSRIYEQAKNVVAWLGLSSLAWEMAIKDMGRLQLTFEKLTRDNKVDWQVLRDAVAACELSEAKRGNIVHFVGGIKSFSRMWTFQEHFLARDIQFLCGDVLVTSMDMWRGATITIVAGRDLPSDRFEWVGDFQQLIFSRLKWETFARGKLPLCINVAISRSRQATDPKDKVFGVFGISQTNDDLDKFENGMPFVVDYSLDVQQIYTRAAVSGLSWMPALEYLSEVGDRRENHTTLPSWVPDFTKAVPWTRFQEPKPTKFRASGNLDVSIGLGLVPDYNVVMFEACPIDSITGICNASWTDMENSGMADFLKLLFHPSPPTTPYDEDVASLILRLVVADGFMNAGLDPRDNLVELFNKWLCNEILIICNEAYQSASDHNFSVLAFFEDPAPWISSLAQTLAIDDCHLETLVDSISKGAPPQCKEIENVATALLDRLREEEHQPKFLYQRLAACKNRYFFRTALGYVGIGPRTVELGDQVMLLKGAPVPYVFRRTSLETGSKLFEFMGEAYLHGFMYGDALEKGDLEWQPIIVV